MSKRFALTTIDNPFNPITDFDNWNQFDMQKGYNSSAYVARIAKDSDQLSDYERELENERAIDEIIKLDFRKIYKKVVSEG